MAHCPTCQQHPGTMRILSAALFGKSAKWFECVHCFRGVAVPGLAAEVGVGVDGWCGGRGGGWVVRAGAVEGGGAVVVDGDRRHTANAVDLGVLVVDGGATGGC